MSAGDPNRPLVLVVEDNADMSRLLATMLSEENRVVSAFDGAEALRLAHALHPDLILTDLMMPVMGGDSLLRQVRAAPDLTDIPVVVLTAKAENALRVDLLREGAHDFLMKPFSADEVRVRIGKLIAMKRAGDALREQLSTKTPDPEPP